MNKQHEFTLSKGATGRLLGDIGSTYGISFRCMAKNEQDAINQLYKKYDHVSGSMIRTDGVL
jgi:hypothetical protein